MGALARDAVGWTGWPVRSRWAAPPPHDPEEVVAQFLAAVRPAVEQSAGGTSCAVAAVTMEAGQVDPRLTEVVDAALRSWVEELECQLRRAGATSEAAAALSMLTVTFLEGAHVLCRATGSVEPFDRGAAGVTAAVRGLVAAGTPPVD